MKHVIFSFMRANPPTRGHERVVSTILEHARRQNADHCVFLSHSHDSKENPLDWQFKLRVFEAAFRGVNISRDSTIRTPFIALERLAESYTRATMIVGEDRLEQFQTRMIPYTQTLGIDLDVISCGNRISESQDIEGISSSRMREFARKGNRTGFIKWLPTGLGESAQDLIYTNTRRALTR
jgi:nicotinic acid mononucleotide adenylyltransferase